MLARECENRETKRAEDRKTESSKPERTGARIPAPQFPGPSPDRSRTSETKTQFQRRLPVGEGSAVPRIISDDRLPV